MQLVHLCTILNGMNAPKLPDYLDKPSGCIHINHDLSGPAMRLFNCLLAWCQDEIVDVDNSTTLTIPRKLIVDYMRTRNDQAVKDWLKELADSSVEFNSLGNGTGKGGPSWGYYHFIQEPEFKGAFVTFTMAKTLRKMIASSTMFAKINMLIERRFKKTKYALPMYELGLDYRDNKDKLSGKSCTPWFDIESFRQYIGVSGKYQEFKLLNRAIIQNALNEIKAESDIVMSLEKEVDNRTVTRIRFIIEDNAVNMSVMDKIKRIRSTLPGLSDEKQTERLYYADVMVKVLGIHGPRAKNIASLYVGHRDKFEEIMRKVKQDKLAGKIKGRVGAYAAKVLTSENPIVQIE